MGRMDLLPTTSPTNTIVLEERFDVRPASDASRVHVSERASFTRGRFNTLENSVTRELTVTGANLHWNGSIPVLEALRTSRDVTRYVLIADEIRIEQVLHWKGANVDIYARRLVFRGSGSIVTTPESHAGSAWTATRSELRGDPLNAAGEIETADGLDGESGGDIRMFVAELDLGGGKVVRLMTDGAPGQTGEAGHTLPFQPRRNGPPTKDVGTVSKNKVLALFKDAANSTNDLKNVKHWKTVGGVGAAGVDSTWAKIQNDGYAVTDVRVGFGFLKVFQWIYNEAQVPSREKQASGRSNVPQQVTFKKAWQKTRELTDPWIPSDGEDAYPSGRTGRGGDGGAIVFSAVTDHASGWFSSRGGVSETSPLTLGGEPGEPQKYVCAAFNANQYAKALLTDVNVIENVMGGDEAAYLGDVDSRIIAGITKPGEDAEGSARGPGTNGKLTRANAHSWLDARLLRTMADYARELYAAGHRERAWEAIAPYWQAMRALSQPALTTDQRSSHQAIQSLVQNYQANLDLYGNPPGWVPRFSASSYLRTYLADRRFSYRFVGVMEKAIQLMGSLEQADAMLGELAARTEDVIDQLRQELFDAFVRYDVARELLEEANDSLKNLQQQLSALESDAQWDAVGQVHDQAIVKAVFDVSGAVLKAIPVYQPALAGIGAVVEGVGGVVASSMNVDPDKPFDGWEAAATISGAVEGMLKENAGSFKSQLEGRLRTRYKDQLDPDAADLRTQVDQLRTTIAESQKQVDASAIEASDALERDELLADLLNTDIAVAERLAENAGNREQLLRDLKAHNQALDGLQPASGSESAVAVANRARQRLLIARAKLHTLQANAQNQDRELQQRIADNVDKRDELEAPRQALAARRAELKARQGALDKLLPDFEKSKAATEIKEAGKTAAGVLEGAQRMAHGAAEIATAISSVSRMPEPENEQVQALKAQILKGKHGEQYAALQEQVEKATASMGEALSGLMAGNQNVTTLTADFAGAIQSSIDIGRNRVAFARGLDAGLKTSLVAMQRQARQRMDYYLYLFRKAYMYEYAEVVGRDVATLNAFVEHLDNWLRDSQAALAGAQEAARASDSLRSLAQLSSMTDSRIGEIGNDAMRHTLGELAAKLLRRRQSQGTPVGNSFRFQVDAKTRETLSREHRAALGSTLDLIASDRDRDAFLKRNPLLKLTSIAIARSDFRFRARTRPESTIRIAFEFGREHVLWDGRSYVMFRIGNSERLLTFGFSANEFTEEANGEWTCVFKADGGGNTDELFKTVSAEALGQAPNYTEINPSFLSSLGAAVILGGDQIEEIVHLSLTIGWQAN